MELKLNRGGLKYTRVSGSRVYGFTSLRVCAMFVSFFANPRGPRGFLRKLQRAGLSSRGLRAKPS